MSDAAIVIAWVLGMALLILWQYSRRAARAEFIRTYSLPYGLFEKLRAKHPALHQKECQLVAHGLRLFFLAHLKSGGQFVSMPSQVADDLWHEFILHTKEYARFCDKAFGKFMHHTPAAVLTSNKQVNTGLRRCWWHACKEENINPRKATRLPLLFALDAKLNIPNGFRYAVDCKGVDAQNRGATAGSVIYCGGDFASSGFDGSTDGFGAGDASGCGGGDGCGGGCGGGD